MSLRGVEKECSKVVQITNKTVSILEIGNYFKLNPKRLRRKTDKGLESET